MVLTRSGDLVSPPKLLPPMSALTSGVLYLLPLRGLQDQHVDVTLAPFKELPQYWGMDYGILHACF